MKYGIYVNGEEVKIVKADSPLEALKQFENDSIFTLILTDNSDDMMVHVKEIRETFIKAWVDLLFKVNI